MIVQEAQRRSPILEDTKLHSIIDLGVETGDRCIHLCPLCKDLFQTTVDSDDTQKEPGDVAKRDQKSAQKAVVSTAPCSRGNTSALAPKSFWCFLDSSMCPNCHRFNFLLDQFLLPSSGVIEVLPLYIKTASVFYGHIVEMASYIADKKPGAKEVLQGELYAVQEEEVFHRMEVFSVPDRGNLLFFSVLARFIDVGKEEEEVKSHQLPERFHMLPAQAVEIIVCRVKPSMPRPAGTQRSSESSARRSEVCSIEPEWSSAWETQFCWSLGRPSPVFTRSGADQQLLRRALDLKRSLEAALQKHKEFHVGYKTRILRVVS
ncbi:hypothetical protein LDENG_00213080 [Lucifuga dentata]|nr:hypothetical protein LDENG_00213080 [Lucifuga dentata]